MKVKFSDAKRINKSDKDFIIFNTDNQNFITDHKLTNDARRNRMRYPKLRLISVVKKELEILNIK